MCIEEVEHDIDILFYYCLTEITPLFWAPLVTCGLLEMGAKVRSAMVFQRTV